MSAVVIHWFRQDLRLHDNPALSAAAEAGDVLPIYVLDDVNAAEQVMGEASRVWLHHSLTALDKSLKGKLQLFVGDANKILTQLCAEHDITAVYWNRCYEPWRIQRDKAIKQKLQAQDVRVISDNGSLLWEPWQVLKSDGTPYKVFTPFYQRGCLGAPSPRLPLAKPKLKLAQLKTNSLTIDDLALLPDRDWHHAMMQPWQVGELAAQKKCQQFLENKLANYKQGRDHPALSSTSRLSPHLHFGEISPNQIWYAADSQPNSDDKQHFLSELGWREFSYSLLYHFPELPSKPFVGKYAKFPWKASKKYLRAWQRGQTGIPIVDAGMRELWQTGYMHNRVRMIVASFLVKNCLIHWHDGEAWFWDCLVDADLASNSASWQWVAGCGVDAAPYYRIFNPVLQGQKFDTDGEYTKHYVPELIALPNKYLFNPWEAPASVLAEAGVKLGQTYPKPIVDLKQSREQALQALNLLKSS